LVGEHCIEESDAAGASSELEPVVVVVECDLGVGPVPAKIVSFAYERLRNDEFETFIAAHPEHRTFNGKGLAFVPTVFNRLDPDLVDALIYRGWWLTGATLAQFHPGMTERRAAHAPPLSAVE